MDKFVQDAFKKAQMEADNREAEAYERFSRIFNTDIVQDGIGFSVGIDRMERMCKAVIEAGEADTLAEYVTKILCFGFHNGYKAGGESV